MIQNLFQKFIATFLLEGSVTFIRMHWGSPAQHTARGPHATRKNFCNCRKCCNSPTSDM